MKVITAENGKKTVKISKSEWETIGKKHGWMRTAVENLMPNSKRPTLSPIVQIQEVANGLVSGIQQGVVALQQALQTNPSMNPQEMAQHLGSGNYMNMEIATQIINMAQKRQGGGTTY